MNTATKRNEKSYKTYRSFHKAFQLAAYENLLVAWYVTDHEYVIILRKRVK